MLASFPNVPTMWSPKTLENRRFRLPHCRLTPYRQGIPANIRINRILRKTIYSHWATSSPLTEWIYLHSRFRGGLHKYTYFATKCVMAVLGHPRSLILVAIESVYTVYLTKPTQPGHPFVGRRNEYWQWFRPPLGKKRRVLRNSRPCYHDCWHSDV